MSSFELGELAPDIVGTNAAISRRHFLRCLTTTVIGITVAHEILTTDEETENHEQQVEDSWNYGDDAETAGKALGVGTASVLALKAVGVEAGNEGLEILVDQARERPIDTAISMVVDAPVLEEALCRFIPSSVADTINPSGKGSSRWILGTVASAAFAGMHKTKQAEEKALPVPQFISGLFFWNVQRKAGYKHTVLSHAFQNAFIYPIILAKAKLSKNS